MTQVERNRRDTKLLITVAGLVVAGVAGIALVGGLSVEDDTGRDTARAAPPRVAEPPPGEEPAPPDALPASYEQPAAQEPPPVETGAEAFVVDPHEDFVARGLEAYASRAFPRAAAYFQAEIDARPQRAWTHYMLGLSLWKAGHPDEAAAAMEGAVKLDPESVRALVNLARIRNDGGDFTGALEAARSALTIAPGDPSALFLEGRSLFNLGRLDDAVASLTASVAIDPGNGYVHNLLGLVLMRQGRALEALPTLERAAQLAPDVAYVHNNLGMALELSGRLSEAVLAYGRSVEVDPTQPKPAANLARLGGVVPPGHPSEPPALDAVAEGEGDGVDVAAAAEIAP